MRGRSYSYSPSPPRGYGRRRRSPSPRGRYGGRARDLPTSLLVRNLRRDCRPEDLRGPFGQFGPLKDIYLPRDFYTGFEDTIEVVRVLWETTLKEPRGFGFIQYIDPTDAADAKRHMDGEILLGRELTVVFAEENRKNPSEMRARERVRGRFYDHGQSPVRYSRSPRYGRSYYHSPVYSSPSPSHRRHSRSISPRDRRYRDRSYSRSPYNPRSRSRTPSSRDRSRSRSLEYSR